MFGVGRDGGQPVDHDNLSRSGRHRADAGCDVHASRRYRREFLYEHDLSPAGHHRTDGRRLVYSDCGRWHQQLHRDHLPDGADGPDRGVDLHACHGRRYQCLDDDDLHAEQCRPGRCRRVRELGTDLGQRLHDDLLYAE